MSFEIFDANMPIETASFLPHGQPAGAEENREPALEAALRQAGAVAGRESAIVDRQAMREAMREATALDLWIERAGGTAFTALDRLEAGEPVPLRKLNPDEMALLYGGTGSDMNGDGGSDGGSHVVVTGNPYWDWNFPNSDDGGGGGGWGGQTGSGTSSQQVADHQQDCGTEDGAAVQVAKHVKGTPPGAGPDNPILVGGLSWRQVEFGAVIVRNADGTYGALNDAIYSNAAVNYVHTPDFDGTNAVGIWHNHPDRGNDAQDAIDSYPSASGQGQRSDWDGLQDLKDAVAPGDPDFDPSLWIMGPDGVTREFKLSERAFFENLSPEQMAARVGLDGKERTQSCD